MSLYRNNSAYLAFLGAMVAAFPAAANDSLATLGAGGLELTLSEDIAMESEDLFLSTGEVRVRYVFRNESNQDITTRVAFPLPEVPFGPMDNVGLPDAGSDNFVDFSVTVDGHVLKPKLDQRAISRPTEIDGQKPSPYRAGKDMTQAVLEAGLPINANLSAWNKKLTELSADDLKRLVQQGVLLAIDDPSPQWALKATYHWEQTFPAGKPIVVEHRYRPVAGSSFLTGDSSDLEQIRSGYQKQYCLDDAGMAGVERLLKKARAANSNGEGDNFLLADEVSYVLTTGANWKGEIGHFKMTMDKSHPEAVLSSCADGIKKIGPTTFEVQRTNFTPKKDIRFVVFTMSDVLDKAK